MRFGRAGGAEHIHSPRLQHLLDAVNVVAVAHDDARLQIHAAHDFGGRHSAFDGAGSLGFGEDGLGGDAVAAQVSATHLAFGESGIAAGAAGGQDAGRPLLAVEKQGVVEPGFQHRRGFSAILRRAQNQDDVGGPHFIHGGLETNVACHGQYLRQRGRGGQAQKNYCDPCQSPSHLRYAGRSESL